MDKQQGFLYSTGDYTHYSVINHNGKDYGKDYEKDLYTYIYIKLNQFAIQQK